MPLEINPSIHSGALPETPSVQQLDIERGIGMMGTDAALRKILQTVSLSLSGSIQEIDAALNTDNVLVANRLLHAIKGYAPIFCTDALIAQITHTEGVSKTASLSVVTPLYDGLRPNLVRLLTNINNYLAES